MSEERLGASFGFSWFLGLVASILMIAAISVDNWTKGDNFKASLWKMCARNTTDSDWVCVDYSNTGVQGDGFRLAAMATGIILIIGGCCAIDPCSLFCCVMYSCICWGCWLGFHKENFEDLDLSLGTGFILTCVVTGLYGVGMLVVCCCCCASGGGGRGLKYPMPHKSFQHARGFATRRPSSSPDEEKGDAVPEMFYANADAPLYPTPDEPVPANTPANTQDNDLGISYPTNVY